MLLCLLVFAGCGTNDKPEQDAVDFRSVRLLSKARADFERGNFARALTSLHTLQSVGPELTDAHFLRGRIYFELNRFDEAEKAYLSVTELDPQYAGVWHNLGNVAFKQRQYRLAIKRYQRELLSGDEPLPWHALGGAYEALGIADSARLAYNQAIATNSNYAPAHSSLADWYEREGLFEEALVEARKAMSIDSSDLKYKFQVGNLLVRQEMYNDGIVLLREVVNEQPWNYGALFALGRALQRTGKPDEASAILNRASSVREVQSQIDLLQNSAQTNHSSFEHQIAYADALRKTNRLDEAINTYMIASHLRPNNLALQNNIATLLLQTGRTESALDMYQNIVKQDSTFGETWINLGAYYSRTGNTQQANEAWTKALRYAPDHPVVQSLKNRLDS